MGAILLFSFRFADWVTTFSPPWRIRNAQGLIRSTRVPGEGSIFTSNRRRIGRAEKIVLETAAGKPEQGP